MAVAADLPGRLRASRGDLLRVLGLGFGIAVVVGGVVGQGIMRTPGIVAGALHDPIWILAAWAVVGLFSLVDAFALIELGASVPRAGGPYAFVERAFGEMAGAGGGERVLGHADVGRALDGEHAEMRMTSHQHDLDRPILEGELGFLRHHRNLPRGVASRKLIQ